MIKSNATQNNICKNNMYIAQNKMYRIWALHLDKIESILIKLSDNSLNN